MSIETKREKLKEQISEQLNGVNEYRVEAYAQIIIASGDFIDDDDICDEYGISRSTLKRWREMKSMPQQFAVPTVFQWIARRIMTREEIKILGTRIVQSSYYTDEKVVEAFPEIFLKIGIFYPSRELSDDIGLSISSLQRWQTGRSMPYVGLMRIIFRYAYKKTSTPP